MSADDDSFHSAKMSFTSISSSVLLCALGAAWQKLMTSWRIVITVISSNIAVIIVSRNIESSMRKSARKGRQHYTIKNYSPT